MSSYNIINFNIIGDDSGSLISIQNEQNIPFAIKRVYYIFNTQNNIIRGKHAHYNLEQVLICVSGSCNVLLDDGKTKKTVYLSKKNEGLYIKDLIWRNMFDFSKDCVLLVLASDFYKEEDYIRNYDKFLEIVNGK